MVGKLNFVFNISIRNWKNLKLRLLLYSLLVHLHSSFPVGGRALKIWKIFYQQILVSAAHTCVLRTKRFVFASNTADEHLVVKAEKCSPKNLGRLHLSYSFGSVICSTLGILCQTLIFLGGKSCGNCIDDLYKLGRNHKIIIFYHHDLSMETM